MESLFSHPSPTAGDPAESPPPRSASVRVPVPVDQAFDGFTDSIRLWWPLESYGKFGLGAHLGFDADTLLEESDDGDSELWAEIETWEVPESLVLRWFLAGDPLLPTRVKVNFRGMDGSGTDVELVQDGWVSDARGAAQYEKYCDWPLILARYARFMGAGPGLD